MGCHLQAGLVVWPLNAAASHPEITQTVIYSTETQHTPIVSVQKGHT